MVDSGLICSIRKPIQLDPEICIRFVSSKIDAIIGVMQNSGLKLELNSYFGCQELDPIIEGNVTFDGAIFGVQL